MNRDPWVLYCEAFREMFPGAGTKIELSPIALDEFYRRILKAERLGVQSPEARDIVLSAIDSEPELPDAMPLQMWEAMKNDYAFAMQAMRAAVRETKKGIRDRYLAAHGCVRPQRVHPSEEKP